VTTPATLATTAALSQDSQHTRAASDALALTLDPVDAGDFLADYREQQPLVVARGEPPRFNGLLAPGDVERLLCDTGIRVPAFRLVKDGAQVPLRTYTEDIRWRPGSFTGTAVVERAADAFARGATIVLQALHLHWPAAALYCRDLEQRLGCPVQANAYHTPASARGFAVHHDTHDVFVLQLAGRKRWRVYEPVLELPLKDQRWSPELGDPGPPIEDFTLEAGDTLYLPRGWPHEATTSDDESLHLTVGMHPQTRLDALRMALDSCEDDIEFRRSMPADGALPEDLLERLAARLAPDELSRLLRRRFVENRRPILHDQLSQLRALERVTVEDQLERRATVIFELEKTNDGGAVLLFEGKEVRFPPQATSAVVAAAESSGPFSADQLPGPLDDEGRLVLVRRLVREGFLRFAVTS
jgi:ribosomal protein L16 Arg81 hydroxylase